MFKDFENVVVIKHISMNTFFKNVCTSNTHTDRQRNLSTNDSNDFLVDKAVRYRTLKYIRFLPKHSVYTKQLIHDVLVMISSPVLTHDYAVYHIQNNL